MTRINLLPGVPNATPEGRTRSRQRPDTLRPRQPLTARELKSVFARVKKRLLAGGEPFGVFAVKCGRGRVFQLLGVSSSQYTRELRVNQARHHLVAVYDGAANLGDVWDDLTSFDQPPAPASVGQNH